jgi:hypothetical protein
MNTPSSTPSTTKRLSLPQVEALCLEKMRDHLPVGGWSFKWSNSLNVLGYCSYTTKTIGLSKRWMVSLPYHEILDTILHEIAHALTPADYGHGKEWKLACKLIGAQPIAKDTSGFKLTDIAVPTYKMVDTTTGKVIKEYYRKPTKKAFRDVPYQWVRGRKESTIGMLVIEKCSLLDLI